MKFRHLILPVALCATLFTLTSCGDKDVVVTYHNGDKDETVTIKSTSDSKEVAKAVKALHYTAYLNKDKSVDLTKGKFGVNGKLDLTTDKIHSSSLSASLVYGLADPKDIAKDEDILNKTALYAELNADLDFPEMQSFSMLSMLTAFKSVSAHAYTDESKLYADVDLDSSVGETVTKTTIKGYLNKANLLPYVSSTDISSEIGGINPFSKSSYTTIYNSLKNYNFYTSLNAVVNANTKDSSTYEDLDEIIELIAGKKETLEKKVQDLGLTISDAKNNQVTFSLDLKKTLAAAGAKIVSSSNEDEFKVNCTIDIENFVGKSLSLDYSSTTQDATATVKKIAAHVELNYEFGNEVPTLTNKSEYIVDFNGFLPQPEPFEPEPFETDPSDTEQDA